MFTDNYLINLFFYIVTFKRIGGVWLPIHPIRATFSTSSCVCEIQNGHLKLNCFSTEQNIHKIYRKLSALVFFSMLYLLADDDWESLEPRGENLDKNPNVLLNSCIFAISDQ